MTRDDIIRMAREAGCMPFRSPEYSDDVQVFATSDVLERFANLVAAAEREACAQIAHDTYEGFGVDAQGVDFIKQHIALAIRERGAP